MESGALPRHLWRPVDVEGTLLPPKDFTPVEAAKYPRLEGVDRAPMGPVGTRWGDGRVAGGAEIAGELLPLWEKLKLDYITALPQSQTETGGSVPVGTTRRAGEFYFAIMTIGTDKSGSGMRILWGRSPAANIPGELTPQQKVNKLEQFFAEHGSLNYPQGPRELDLRQ